MQHRLGLTARATKDLDGIIRGDIDEFIDALDAMLYEDWGPISFQRSEVETIRAPAKLLKPRRFELSLIIKGQTWRKVQIEISPSEGHATDSFDVFPAPQLDAFGIPSPEYLVALSLSYQIAQKVHGASDPHDPPISVNRRARDIVDLVLLKDLAESTSTPSFEEIRIAIEDVFEMRAHEARLLGLNERTLPVEVVSYPHWEMDYREAASSASLEMPLDEAVTIVNDWLKDLGVREL